MSSIRLVLGCVLVLTACGRPPGGEGDAGGALPDAAVGGPDAGGGGDGGGRDAGADAGPRDGGAGVDAGGPDAGSLDAGPGPFDAGSLNPDGGLTLTPVAAPRELRGVWVATVSNLDWPSSATLSADAGRAQLDALVQQLADVGVNALFFQVRPESDALYASALEPWSRFLTGTQGVDPGWDPLAHLLTAAHARGVEVHAWVNPYRGLVSGATVAATNHVTRRLAAHAVPYNNAVVMNPGEPAVRQHVVAVVGDLLSHYDVDGLHFDDYFYPYPDAAQTPFPDSATYAGYQADGGTLAKADWRRENVNALVREVKALVAAEHPQVRFGISPFGIWKAGVPVPGLDAYNAISCDAVTWMQQGWVDYLAPQLYWAESSAQSYSVLASWWSQQLSGGRHLFPGHATYKLDAASGNWPLSELRGQVAATRSHAAQGAKGDLHFRAKYITADPKGVLGLFRDELYRAPALPPVLPRAGASVAPPVPFVAVQGSTLAVTSPLPPSTRFFALYRLNLSGQWELTHVRGGPQASFPVTSGAWAVSAVARGGAESDGVRVQVP